MLLQSVICNRHDYFLDMFSMHAYGRGGAYHNYNCNYNYNYNYNYNNFLVFSEGGRMRKKLQTECAYEKITGIS